MWPLSSSVRPMETIRVDGKDIQVHELSFHPASRSRVLRPVNAQGLLIEFTWSSGPFKIDLQGIHHLSAAESELYLRGDLQVDTLARQLASNRESLA